MIDDRIERLTLEIESCGDADLREKTRELMRLMLELHGEGLRRFVELSSIDPSGRRAFLDRLASDRVASTLLVLHGLHPVGTRERIEGALEKVRPALSRHAGGVEFLSEAEGVVRLKFSGACVGCPSSARTARELIERAVFEAAPDVIRVEMEGAA